MNRSTVLAYLKKNQDARGIEHWKNHNKSALKSYGIGLTILRKYAKSIGRDAKLAKSLWNSDVHEMKIISILIDDPKTMTIERKVKNKYAKAWTVAISACSENFIVAS